MPDWKRTLAELRYAEQEAAAAYEEAVGAWAADSDTARELHRLRAAHARRAEGIDGAFFGHGDAGELTDEARFALQQQVWRAEQARGRPDEVRVLLEAEREHVERYQRASTLPMPSEAAEIVRAGLAEERAAIAALERLQATMPHASKR